MEQILETEGIEVRPYIWMFSPSPEYEKTLAATNSI